MYIHVVLKSEWIQSPLTNCCSVMLHFELLCVCLRSSQTILLTSYWVILIRNLRSVSYIWMHSKHFSDTSEYFITKMCKILSLYTSSYWQWFKLTESWYGIITFWKILNGKLDTCVPAVRKHKLLNMPRREKINCSELSTPESVQFFLHDGHALKIYPPSSIISFKLNIIICRRPPDF